MNYLVSPNISEEVDDSLAGNIIGDAIDVRRYKNPLSVSSVGSVGVLIAARAFAPAQIPAFSMEQYILFPIQSYCNSFISRNFSSIDAIILFLITSYEI